MGARVMESREYERAMGKTFYAAFLIDPDTFIWKLCSSRRETIRGVTLYVSRLQPTSRGPRYFPAASGLRRLQPLSAVWWIELSWKSGGSRLTQCFGVCPDFRVKLRRVTPRKILCRRHFPTNCDLQRFTVPRELCCNAKEQWTNVASRFQDAFLQSRESRRPSIFGLSGVRFQLTSTWLSICNGDLNRGLLIISSKRINIYLELLIVFRRVKC